MKKFKIVNLILIIVISGCYNKPKNLSLAKQEVEDYYTSGKYQKELEKIINTAKKHFSKPAKNNETVIFDIDETALSDFENYKNLDFGYIPKLYHEWILCACAKAIPEVKELYDHLINLGYTIIFLTGRKHNDYDPTYKNLINQGYTKFEKLIVRSKEEANLSAKEYKSNARAKLANQGYKIVGSIGDQESDITGPYIGKGIKLPNYIYIIK